MQHDRRSEQIKNWYQLKVEPALSSLLEKAAILTPYVSEFRYPGDVELPNKEEVDNA